MNSNEVNRQSHSQIYESLLTSVTWKNEFGFFVVAIPSGKFASIEALHLLSSLQSSYGNVAAILHYQQYHLKKIGKDIPGSTRH